MSYLRSAKERKKGKKSTEAFLKEGEEKMQNNMIWHGIEPQTFCEAEMLSRCHNQLDHPTCYGQWLKIKYIILRFGMWGRMRGYGSK